MIPDSTIYICSNIKLRSDMLNTIYFSSLSAQRSYFAGKVVRTFTDYTIIRNNVAYVESDLGESETWNYCMIEDKANGDSLMRRFYFIESVEYIDELTTALHLKLDVMQTFQHQPNGGYAGNLPQCFVEREHSLYDGKYAFNGDSYNTLEERIDTGEFITRDYHSILGDEWWIIVASTLELSNFRTDSTSVQNSYGSVINGFYTGIGFYAVRLNFSGTLGTCINVLSDLGRIDGILDMYLLPKTMFTCERENEDEILGQPFHKVTAIQHYSDLIPIPTSIGSYTPRNKKLLQYPYLFLYLTDCRGLSTVYRPEYFEPNPEQSPTNTLVSFTFDSNVMQDAGVHVYPETKYKGLQPNKEEGISIQNFPRIPWVSDQYALWLAQTANTRRYNLEVAEFNRQAGIIDVTTNTLQNTVEGVGGILTAALTGGILGMDKIASSISNEIKNVGTEWKVNRSYELSKKAIDAQIKDHAITPPAARGGSSGLLSYIAHTAKPWLYIKSIDEMHARIIDEYFDHWGYQTNSFKVPNIHSRPNWNYVKTGGFDVKINIPNMYRVEISRIFDAGITFWKNGDQVGNYSLNNAASTPS